MCSPLTPSKDMNFYMRSEKRNRIYLLLLGSLFFTTFSIVSCRNESEGYIKKALDHYQHREYEEAIEPLDFVISAEPNLVDAYVIRGNAYVRLGRYDEAIEDYTAAININPNLGY